MIHYQEAGLKTFNWCLLSLTFPFLLVHSGQFLLPLGKYLHRCLLFVFFCLPSLFGCSFVIIIIIIIMMKEEDSF